MIKSTAVFIGEMVQALKEEKIMVLFGPKAPKELREISVIHEFDTIDKDVLLKERHFIIDGKVYDIVSVGTEAVKNLVELGHVSVYFMDPPENVLPGSIYVKPNVVPHVKIGSIIEFR